MISDLDSIIGKNGLDMLVVYTHKNSEEMNYLTNFSDIDFGIYVKKRGEEPFLVFYGPEEYKLKNCGINDLRELSSVLDYSSLCDKIGAEQAGKEYYARVLEKLGVSGKAFFITSAWDNNVFHSMNFINDYLSLDLPKSRNPIAESRVTKSDDELNQIREATRCSNEFFSVFREYLSRMENISVGNARNFLESFFNSRGFTIDYAFLVGDDCLEYHGKSDEDKAIRAGDSIIVDVWPVRNYFSDMTRTFCLGSPSQELGEAYNAVLAVHDKCLKLIGDNAGKEGFTLKQVDGFARDLFKEKGYPADITGKMGFKHLIGHGVGMEVHEKPFAYDDSQIIPGCIVAIEPGLYFDSFGVRLEDLILVKKKGIENLSSFERVLTV